MGCPENSLSNNVTGPRLQSLSLAGTAFGYVVKCLLIVRRDSQGTPPVVHIFKGGPSLPSTTTRRRPVFRGTGGLLVGHLLYLPVRA